MAASDIRHSDLVAFADVAAGHDGVLSDPSGALVIKPCTAEEVAFYEASVSDHPAFAAHIPTFMGTLGMSSPEQTKALANQDPTSLNAALQAQEGTAEALAIDGSAETAPEAAAKISSVHGKKLDTQQAVVLENIAGGFVRPNVLDVKLGARLWAEDARPEKRMRLDKVAGETTSGSLGFRIAGMRVWEPSRPWTGDRDAQGEFKVYDKSYGRSLYAGNVRSAFEEFFFSKADPDNKHRQLVLRKCADEVKHIQAVLENEESRMYSSSILFTFEGDAKALEEAVEAAVAHPPSIRAEGDADDNQEEDEDEDELPPICKTKLIDFAHARWTPGEGPDENALHGVRSTRKILEDMLGNN